MIDNFKKVEKLLTFPDKDNFYFVQILQRKKDHPGVMLGGSNNNSRLIKAYYIDSVEKLNIHKEEIIKLCELFNARACINLNPRSYEKAAFQLLIKVSNQMQNKDWKGVVKSYDSICGHYHAEIDKRWLIDIDVKDVEFLSTVVKEIEDIHSTINDRAYRILAILDTRSGYHIITNPFNLAVFSKKFPEIDVHKNNPTLLYCI